jgi:hypothetical protein
MMNRTAGGQAPPPPSVDMFEFDYADNEDDDIEEDLELSVMDAQVMPDTVREAAEEHGRAQDFINGYSK